MCDAEFVPEAVEYTTDEDGVKRVGFIEGEEPKMTPLPEEKEYDGAPGPTGTSSPQENIQN